MRLARSARVRGLKGSTRLSLHDRFWGTGVITFLSDDMGGARRTRDNCVSPSNSHFARFVRSPPAPALCVAYNVNKQPRVLFGKQWPFTSGQSQPVPFSRPKGEEGGTRGRTQLNRKTKSPAHVNLRDELEKTKKNTTGKKVAAIKNHHQFFPISFFSFSCRTNRAQSKQNGEPRT